MNKVTKYGPYLSGAAMIVFGVLGLALHQLATDQALIAISGGFSLLGLHHNAVSE